MILEGFPCLLLCWLPQAFHKENRLLFIGSHTDTILVPGGATKLFAIAVERLVALSDAVKRLVQPYLARQDNAVLNPFQSHKYLM